MILQAYKNSYITTLIDVSENTIKNSMRMLNFPHHQLLLVDSPGYAVSQETTETSFLAGDVIFVAAGQNFGIRCDGLMRIYHIAFSGKNIRPFLHYCRFGRFRITTLAKNDAVRNLFNKIFALKDSSAADKNIRLSMELYSLLSELGAANIENDNYIYDKKSLILHPIIEFMQKNYRNPSLSYEDFVLALGITPMELDGLFVDVFSVDASTFYKRLRMENAKHLLFYYSYYDEDHIAKNIGYTDKSQFRADFFECFQMTPAEFIQLYKR